MAFTIYFTIYFQDFSFIPSFGCTVYFSRGACTVMSLSLLNSEISRTITSPIAIKVLFSPWERKGTQNAIALNNGWPYAKERRELKRGENGQISHLFSLLMIIMQRNFFAGFFLEITSTISGYSE